MAAKKNTRITIETERLLVIHRGAAVRVWCQQCASEVDMVPLESAAELAQVDVETIQHLLDNEKLHWSQPGGPVRICLNSLLKSFQKESSEFGLDIRPRIPAVED